MRLRPLILAGVIALFLYWVVNDPVGAALVLQQLWEVALNLLQLVAARLVEFLNALV